jgi:hypothetical protein
MMVEKIIIKPGAEVGQSWGRLYAHGRTGRHADMPRHAVGRKRYQMMPNDTKIKAIFEVKKLNQNEPKYTKKLHQVALNGTKKRTTQRLDKSWMKIGQEKMASSCRHLILPNVSFMCCVARGLL